MTVAAHVVVKLLHETSDTSVLAAIAAVRPDLHTISGPLEYVHKKLEFVMNKKVYAHQSDACTIVYREYAVNHFYSHSKVNS